MASKLDANKLVIGLKKDFKKEAGPVKGNGVESVIKKIHSVADENKKDSEDKATKRLTLDVEKPLHKKIARHVLDKDISFKDYFLELAKKDLGIN